MRRQTFNEMIENRQFRELFIMEMGWNNVHGNAQLPIYVIDEKEISITAIAERNGFQVLQCEAEDIPSSSFCKKLDLKLRKQADSYILIFHQPHSLHHLWVAPVKKTEKRDLVFIEYETLDQADFLFSKIDGLTFDVDEHTTIMDVKERIQAAFVVNSEKLTKDFYQGFRKQHTSFTTFITGIDDYIDEENKKRPKNQQVENKNKQWYASIMLNRLMFCYFIQKKGFLDNNMNYLRDKLAWVRREQGENRFFQSFYRGFLTQLFHDGLNDPRHSREFENMYGRIPYLNGGMFDVHTLEQQYADIDISDEAFESLFAFFDQWHWHLDDRHTATGKDINPDVLGYIFEQYINDRAAMGAYYTKEDITEYIGKNCILPFLMDKVRTATQDSEKYFRPNGYVWQTLAQSGDSYIYDAVKKGYTDDWQEQIPDYIAKGIDTDEPHLLERRSRWNERTSEAFALPTEIWRETIERLQRCSSLLEKIYAGDITEINDFITYNLDIRQFVYDLLLNADDHHFVAHFYHAMQHVTILDPTCGSGAFLFAAMNILEPLYEVCIERMEQWHEENPNLFKDELDEINRNYRSNRQYFIYKSIILRNLYGVDIMAEATEIAKLRLFLKMVAVVEVDMRADNLGLDPLPDIDFNIRCGNTLVGYATEKEMEEGVKYMDLFARQEFEDKVYQEMDIVSTAYHTFRKVQLEQDEDLVTFKQAKAQLKERLANLNELLNHNLHTATAPGMDFGKWKKSHQPFHWFAEFYEIIYGNGGFDVIIGNPPYVEYNKKVKGVAVSDIYKIHGYTTITCGNLYAYCIERSKVILNEDAVFGMIVPLSLSCGNRMDVLRNFINSNFANNFFANFEIFPSKLFDGAFQRITIDISNNLCNSTNHSITKLHRWYSAERTNLFKKMYFVDLQYTLPDIGFAKLNTNFHSDVLNKIISFPSLANIVIKLNHRNFIYYQEATNYWMKAAMRIPYYKKNNIIEEPAHGRKIYFESKNGKQAVFSILNSSLFYSWFIAFSDGFHLSDNVVKRFPIDIELVNNQELLELTEKLKADIDNNSFITTRNTDTDNIEIESFRVNKSKPIIDEIDKVLAKHYGFTDEELDFIINYDIKYRMGDELNEE